MALVVVLALLVLVSGLVVALLQSLRTESASATSYQQGVSSRLLAETALNIVIGQIQEATQRPGEAWISQPGLIRTFGAGGRPASAYKLFSANPMMVSGAYDPLVGDDLPGAGWEARINEWVDLNKPIPTAVGNGTALLFPILDPQADAEGFSRDSAWTSNQRAPMPVRWLYYLKNGELVAAEPTASDEVVKIPGASLENPPIARLAFWTDDETCKLNVNTASAGVAWDTPMAATFMADRSNYLPDPFGRQWEADYAAFMPVKNEFQRYGGHPATTSLTPALGRGLRNALGMNASLGPLETISYLANLYTLTPRYAGGESWLNYSSRGGFRGAQDADDQRLQLNSDRFYANTDEFLFAAGRTSGRRDENPLDSTSEGRWRAAQKLAFFLTTASSAPEINLFKKPRVATWPVWGDARAGDRTGFDRLMLFCASLGDGTASQRYILTRLDASSPTVDFSGRNAALYAYLRGLLQRDFPGFSGSLAGKWGNDTEQVLTEVFDFIRCLNLADTTQNAPFVAMDKNVEMGQVVPLDPGNNTRGFGRIATISEVSLHFIQQTGNFTGANRTLEMAVYPELFCPMAGLPAYAPNLVCEWEDLDKVVVSVEGNDYTPFSSSPSWKMTTQGLLERNGQSRQGGYLGPGRFFLNTNQIPVATVDRRSGPAFSGNLTVRGGSRFRCRLGTPAHPNLQTFEFEIPNDVELPMPEGNTQSFVTRFGRAIETNPQDLAVTNVNADTILSLVPSGGSPNIQGDLRLVAATENPGAYFSPFPRNAIAEDATTRWRRLNHSHRGGYNQNTNGATFGLLVKNMDGYDRNPAPTSFSPRLAGGTMQSSGANISISPDIPPNINGVTNHLGQPGDWDTGPALHIDGPYVNKPDEGPGPLAAGKFRRGITLGLGLGSATIRYIGHTDNHEEVDVVERTFFTPNRMMPSPVMFGSLPTGVRRGQSWQTLLFRPAADWWPGGASHPGAGTGSAPPDHLLLDLFWMPVVEPLALSERFSTKGKVNLNYQIVPFTYLTRSTGIHGLLESVKVAAIEPSAPTNNGPMIYQYKRPLASSPARGAVGDNARTRLPVDVASTLAFFEERFAENRPFISESEICDIPLVPRDLVGGPASPATIRSALQSFWQNRRLTGDNLLERPYAFLHPRVTTKSNAYTVHVRAERLSCTPASLRRGEFDSATDQVAGRFVGSFLIERFLDPNTASLVRLDDSGKEVPATENDADSYLGPYRIRVLQTRQLSF